METDKQDAQLQAAAKQTADYVGADEFAVDDPLELIYKFIFNPNSKFQEINKGWSLTNLNSEDVRRIQDLAKNIRILDQDKFKEQIIIEQPTGNMLQYKDDDGVIIQEPEVDKFKIERSRFYQLIEKDLGQIDSITAAAGGRSGSLVRAFRTTTMQQHQSLEDKTAPKSSWLGRSKKE